MQRYFQYGLLALTILVFLSQFIWRGGGAGVVNSIVVFAIAWWIILFIMLPIGIRSQADEGEVTQGTESGAPTDPQLKKKAWWTTMATCCFWLVWTVVAEFELIRFPTTSWG